MRGILATVAMVTFLIAASSCFAFDLPDGWRYPTRDEYMNNFREMSGQEFLTVSGDFNGDGVKDEARLCVSDDGKDMGIIVWISKGEQFAVFILGKSEFWIDSVGIELVKPGEYKTACGKGYFNCGPDEPELLKIKTDAIDYIVFERANSIFFWDTEDNNFNRIWMSD